MDGNLVSHPNVCLHSRIAFQSLFEAANTRARWWSLEVGRGYSTLPVPLLDPASLDFAPKYGRLQILERIVDLSVRISERFDFFVAHSFLLAPRYSY